MDYLTAFVTARLDERETAAREHLTRYVDGEWARVICDPIIGAFGGQSAARDIATGMYVAAMSEPARVLREVDAMRKIVAEHAWSCCVKETCCGEIAATYDAESGDPCPTLRSLGSIWDAHPGYRPEWAPDVAQT